jgi:hypothetical protein
MAERKQTLGALAAISSALLLLAASSAWAGQRKSGNDTLPGVRPQKPIASHDGVYPPEPDAPQNGDDPTSFRIGEMKVQIHGYISYAVGFGKPMPGRGSRNN